MIPSPEDIRAYLSSHAGRTAAIREIIRHFGVPASDRPAFRRMVKDLAREGFLVRGRGGRYASPESMNLVEGTLQAHPDGYGFVSPVKREKPPEGDRILEDIFVPATRRGTALHGDRVLVRARHGLRGGWEGEVIRVLKRGTDRIIGRIEGKAGRRWLVPLDHRFGEAMTFAKGGDDPEARRGMVVLFQMTGYPTGMGVVRRRRRFASPPQPAATGKIVRVIGYPEDPQVVIDMICAEFGIRTEYPKSVLQEAKNQQSPDARELSRRQDLRDLLTVTIDGETAHDFDDAVSLETLAGGKRRLGVHIADVSHYVTEDSELDEEARQRGTSVYFPGAAVQMLPPRLSGDLCSLLPDRDRLAVTVLMDYDAMGCRISVRITQTVIRSRARLTFSGVSGFLEGEVESHGSAALPPDVTPPGRYSEIPGLEKTLREMAKLARQLRERRLSEGGLDLDIPDAEILVDDMGHVTELRRAPRLIAHEIVEDFMLAANRAVAELLTDPSGGTAEGEEAGAGMFRVHEPPDPSKLEEVAFLLRNLHHRVPGLSSASPEGLRLALEATRELPEDALVNMAILRAMKLARYDSDNLGHYGLGFTHYTHFTSPIRRYPDLLVHRLLRARGLTGLRKMGRRRLQSLEDKLPTLAEEVSRLERSAVGAERAMLDYKRAQFMQDHVGEVYDGKVSGIIPTGFFVTLDEHFVDGFVPLADLSDDDYEFIEEDYELAGRRTKRAIRLGDAVTVRVVRADLDRRRIDFSWVEPTSSMGRRTASKTGKGQASPKSGRRPSGSRRLPRKPKRAGRGRGRRS